MEQISIPGADHTDGKDLERRKALELATLRGRQSKLRASKPQQSAGGMFAEIQTDLLSAAAPVRPTRLLILACSQVKRDDAGLMSAIDRYNGPLWQTLRTYLANAKTPTAVAFVSAKYGFKAADTPIENYDLRMSKARADELAVKELGPMCEVSRLCRELGRRPFSEVCIVGGELYLPVMEALVATFKLENQVSPGADVRTINDTIGNMRAQLRAWIEE